MYGVAGFVATRNAFSQAQLGAPAVLYRQVSRQLIERPKQGGDVPVEHWLRGELRAWAETLLDPAKLREQGFFDPAVIRRQWREHLDGRRNWHYSLWDVLMFQAWREHTSRQSPVDLDTAVAGI